MVGLGANPTSMALKVPEILPRASSTPRRPKPSTSFVAAILISTLAGAGVLSCGRDRPPQGGTVRPPATTSSQPGPVAPAAALAPGLSLVPRPTELRMGDRSRFVLDVVVTNRGTTSMDPSLDRARLTVDGEDSVYFALAMGNGIREPTQLLAPSETATTSWPGMGKVLFPRPGEYTLVLSLGDASAPPVQVRVRRR